MSDDNAIQELATTAFFKGFLSRRDVREYNANKTELNEDMLREVNRKLRKAKIKIVSCPKPMGSSRVDCSYISTGMELVNSLDTIIQGVDYSKLAFILCFIYVSNQVSTKKDILLHSFLNESDLDAMKKHMYLEINKDFVYWGVKSRVTWNHTHIINCLNSHYQKDMTEAIKKAGKFNGSYEINRD